MTEMLAADDVAVRLFQSNKLSLRELQKVQCAQTPVEAAEYLLNRILNNHSKVSYECFLKALKDSGQGHLYMWLTDEGLLFCSVINTILATCLLS
jgi:hypothetical protein